MKLNNYFEVSRFWLLLKMEFYRSQKVLIITFVVTFGMLFFVDLLLSTLIEYNKVVHEHSQSYAFTLLIGGFVLSSMAFMDLGSVLKRSNYLTLPVSTLERFICMWLLTSAGWVILFSVTFYSYTLLANFVGQLLFNHVKFQSFELFGDFAISTMKYYFVLQGIFLMGSAYFKGYALVKTLFAAILLSMLSGIIFYLLIGDVMEAAEICLNDTDPLMDMPVHKFWIIVQGLFWWVLAPCCWLATYLGLKDQEV